MPLRRLLRPIRRAALDASLSGLSPVTAPSTGRPMVVGFLSAPMGIGAGGARLHAGLSALGFAPSSFDLTPIYQKDRAILPWPPEGEKEDDGRGPVLVHVNAPESPHALSAVGKARLKGRFLAGYWAWELPLVPPAWIEAAKRYHEIWVPSDFTANSLRPALGDKVKVVGYPLDPPAIDAETVAAIRQRYLPDPDAGFLALAAGDARSSMSRKNPGAAIRAFRSAFPDRDDVRLLVKTSGLASASAAVRHRLDAAIGGDPRIILHDEPLPQAEFDALFAAADVFISLHRSEGFGLSIAGSLLAGTPVVVTGWSGNMDFAALPGTHAVGFTLVTPQADQAQYNLAGAVWADPDEGEAAAILAGLARPSDKERQAIARTAEAYFAPSAWRQHLTPAFLAACERN